VATAYDICLHSTMSSQEADCTTKKLGPLSYRDSGIPDGSNDFTTLVMLHGFAFHAREYSVHA
jgi:hypothetical protein